jgi:hypothetical protein
MPAEHHLFFFILKNIPSSTEAPPVSHPLGLLQLDTPPEDLLGLVRLSAVLMGASEGEPGL